jgi:hypothetical protein
MFVAASIASSFATGVGLLAAAIAVGGFLSHVRPALSGASEQAIRGATVVGGVIGFICGGLVIVLSAVIGSLVP